MKGPMVCFWEQQSRKTNTDRQQTEDTYITLRKEFGPADM